MTAVMPDGPAFLDRLERILPGPRVTTQPDALDRLGRDHTFVIEPGRALAACFPVDTAETSRVVALAAEFGVPIVPRGLGTGLAGGATAIDGCLIVSFERMDRIIQIDPLDGVAVVEPGVTNAALQAAATAEGLFYAPDPASFEISSIGGNIATNAGGLRCLQYGVTREAVLALEVVMASGAVVTVGRRSLKGVAGYDLAALLVGSEGTLGLITRATVRLRPLAAGLATLLATFPSLGSAGSAVTSIFARGLAPAVLEIMDRPTLRAIESWQGLGFDGSIDAVLIAQVPDGGQDGRPSSAIEEACRVAGATEVYASTTPAESDGLMSARRSAFPALERMGATLLEDVAVPRGRLVALIEEIQAIAARHEVVIGTFGHVGDGNLHPTIVWDPAVMTTERIERAADDIVEATLRLGGTITGEHGVGLLKRRFLEREVGSEVVRLSRAVKAVFDPAGILNPGKVFGT